MAYPNISFIIDELLECVQVPVLQIQNYDTGNKGDIQETAPEVPVLPM